MKIPFEKWRVDKSPAKAGVYVLYRDGEIIYIGRAQGGSVTIRSRLQRHLAGTEGSTKTATHYWRQVVANPVEREKQLLIWYKRRYGRLPRYNERIG